MHVRQTGEVPLVDDCGGEARLGENHDTSGRLDEMSAGARADDEEERILDLAMHPDDARETAEHRMLSAALPHWRVDAAACLCAAELEWRHVVHDDASAERSSRARRSFRRNWAALTT